MSFYRIKFNDIKWATSFENDKKVRTHLPKTFERTIEARDKWDAYVKTKARLESDYGIPIEGAGGYSVKLIMPEALGHPAEQMYVVIIRDIDWDVEGYEHSSHTSHLPKNSGRIVSATNEKDALAIAMEKISDDSGFLINDIGTYEVVKMHLATKQNINYLSLGEVFFRRKK
jgi:hypothetical protein